MAIAVESIARERSHRYPPRRGSRQQAVTGTDARARRYPRTQKTDIIRTQVCLVFQPTRSAHHRECTFTQDAIVVAIEFARRYLRLRSEARRSGRFHPDPIRANAPKRSVAAQYVRTQRVFANACEMFTEPVRLGLRCTPRHSKVRSSRRFCLQHQRPSPQSAEFETLLAQRDGPVGRTRSSQSVRQDLSTCSARRHGAPSAHSSWKMGRRENSTSASFMISRGGSYPGKRPTHATNSEEQRMNAHLAKPRITVAEFCAHT